MDAMCEKNLTVTLEVLASTNIRRRKPWSDIVWLGEEKESLVLLDSQRMSILYVPSGKTRRKIPNVTPLLPDVVVLHSSQNGLYLVGLLTGGAVFFWNKDQDELQLVQGLTEVTQDWEQERDSCFIFISDDSTKILLVTEFQRVYVWIKSRVEMKTNIKQINAEGIWYRLDLPDDLFVPSESGAAVISSIFFSNQVTGPCCCCSFVFHHNDQLCIITLCLRFLESASNRSLSFHTEWNVLKYSLPAGGGQFVNCSGALVASYSHDGQVLAVAVNQSEVNGNKIVFVSTLTNTVVLSEINDHSCNLEISSDYYWVSKMSWTYDDLFLACILGIGSICLLPRLGEPVMIEAVGHQVNMGPACFLPLHPVVIVSENKIEMSTSGQTSELAVGDMGQKFSVTAHPRLPIILCSDGYLVTVLQLRADSTCLSLMRNLVLTSSHHLSAVSSNSNIGLTLVNAYDTPSERHHQPVETHHNGYLPYQFEEAQDSLNASQDSELSTIDKPFQNLNSGKIIFGVSENRGHLQKLKYSETSDSLSVVNIKLAYRNLMLAWKLGVTSGGNWDQSLEKVIKQTLHNVLKLLTLLLDTPTLAIAFSGVSELSQQANNQVLFQVVTVFKEILYFLQFDGLFQHLNMVAITFVHKLVRLMLTSMGLSQTDHRLKTLLGCETLLNYSWEIIQKIYMHQSLLFPNLIAKKLGSENQEVFVERFLLTWKLLLKNAVSYQSSEDFRSHESSILNQLINRLSDRLPCVTPTVTENSYNISAGNKYSLECMHTHAIEAWKLHLSTLTDDISDGEAGRILHAILYTYLLNDELDEAVNLVETLVLKADIRAVTKEPLHKPLAKPFFFSLLSGSFNLQEQMGSCIKNAAIQKTVQTLGRFMARYFTNTSVYIFPPNSPQPLSPVHLENRQMRGRIIPKYHAEITKIVTRRDLEEIWTVERTLEYLLVGGLVCEAIWFADQMGDWKAALLISTAHAHHREIAPAVYERTDDDLELPKNLWPGAIIERKLTSLLLPSGSRDSHSSMTSATFEIEDENLLEQLHSTVESILTAAIMCKVDMVPWLLARLVEKLKTIVNMFHPNVPEELHLPAPPFYCWQPADTSELPPVDSEIFWEKKLRHQASTLIRLTLTVLKAAHLSLPLARWYVSQLVTAQTRSRKVQVFGDAICADLPGFLQTFCAEESSLTRHKSQPCVSPALATFRTFCAILWLLHARDTLSFHMRGRREYLEKYLTACRESVDEVWQQKCQVCLRWAGHMIAFSRFFSDEAWVYKVVLSLVAELPTTTESVDVLAEYFHNMESLDSEVQQKLEELLKQWQASVVEQAGGNSAVIEGTLSYVNRSSTHGMSLSVYFQNQCQKMTRILEKKRKCFGEYREFVFSKASEEAEQKTVGRLHVGSFPFETKSDYLTFLDITFDVAFKRMLENEQALGAKLGHSPLLVPFTKVIRKTELQSMSFKVLSGVQRRQTLLMLSSPVKEATDSPSKFHGLFPKEQLQKKNKGLFQRSFSVDASNDKTGKQQFLNGKINKKFQKAISEGLPPEAGVQGNNTPRQPQEKTRLLESLGQNSPEASSDQLWSLDMNFGTKYHYLQQLLDWLVYWGNKSHSLVMGYNDKKLAIRIQVLPQLVVLSLWLLEHKYQPGRFRDVSVVKSVQEEGKKDKKKSKMKNWKNKQQSIVEPGLDSILFFQKTQSKEVVNSKNELFEVLDSTKSTAEEIKKTVSSSSISRSHLFCKEEKKQIKKAYEKALKILDDENFEGTLSLKDEVDVSMQCADHREGFVQENPRKLPPSLTLSSDQEANAIEHSMTPTQPHRSHLLNPVVHSEMENTVHHFQRFPDVGKDIQVVVQQEIRAMMQAQNQRLISVVGALCGSDQVNSNQSALESKQDTHTKRKPQQDLAGQRTENTTQGQPSVNSKVFQTIKQGCCSGNLNGVLQELNSLQISEKQKKSSSSGEVRRPESFACQSQGNFFKSNKVSMALYENQQMPQLLSLPEIQTSFRPGYFTKKENKPATVRIPLLKLEKEDVLLQIRYGASERTLHDFAASHQMMSSVYLKQPFPQMMQNWDPAFHRLPSPNVTRLPLLRLLQDSRSSFDQHPFPYLLPPHLIMAYEQKLQQKEREKWKYFEHFQQQQLQELRSQQTEGIFQPLLKLRLPIGDLKVTMNKNSEKRSVRRKRKEQEREELKKSGAEVPLPSTVKTKQIALEQLAESPSVTEKKVESQEDNIPVHSGYVVTPGIFENYLHLGEELGVPKETYAQIQYDVATGIAKLHEKKKVDFATMTKEMRDAEVETDPVSDEGGVVVIRRTDAATSITRDTGTDPVQEALMAYNRSRQGNILAPDIYFQLKFREPSKESEEGKVTETVDTSQNGGDGHTFLNVVDIRSSEVMKAIPSPRIEESAEERLYVAKSLQSPKGELYPAPSLPLLENQEKDARHKLKEMAEAGPDPVTIKMFETRVNDDEKCTVAILPRRSVTQQSKESIMRNLQNMDNQMAMVDDLAKKLQDEYQQTHLFIKTVDAFKAFEMPEESQMKVGVRNDARFTSKVGVDEKILIPQSSEKSPKHSTRTLSTPSGVSNSREDRIMKLSGLSDIEALTSSINTPYTDMGISYQNESLKSRQVNDSVQISVDKLSQIARDTEVNANKQRHQELHEWMVRKKADQVSEYKKHLQTLLEKETHPFKRPDNMRQITSREIDASIKAREENRMELHKICNEKRIEEAEKLIQDFMNDRSVMDELLTNRSSPSPTRKQEIGRVTARKKSPHRPPMKSSNGRRSAQRSCTAAHSTSRTVLQSPADFGSQSTVFHSLDRVVFMDSNKENSGICEGTVKYQTVPKPQQEVGKPYVPQPFTAFVRLQRPEVTKTHPKTKSAHDVSSVKLPFSLPKQNIQSPRQPTLKIQQRIYGCEKHPKEELPSASGPRHVKTYTQRLQDMKRDARKTQPTVPIVPRQRKIPTGTYRLRTAWHGEPTPQSSHVDRRSAHTPKGTARRQGPPHKPTTYVRQLQELKPQQTATGVLRISTERSSSRLRPYADPYSDLDDDTSLLSSWSLDDRMKEILYGDDGNLVDAEVPSRDVLEDTDKLPVFSLSTGSSSTYIDWDSLENLIRHEI